MQKSTSILLNSIILLFLSSCVLLTRSATEAQPIATVTVDAGAHTRIDTPVSVTLDGIPLGFPDEKFHLVEVGDAKKNRIPAQYEAGSPPKLWFILSDKTKAGGKRLYELYNGGDGTDMVNIETKKDNKRLVVQREEDRILSYQHAVMPPPEGLNQIYQRSGFIYPIWSPTGNIVTEIHPKDHIHHFGIWMPWTHTKYEGKLVDFWNIDDGTGTIRFSRFISTTEGPVYGGFQAEQDHVAVKTSAVEKVILKEVWDIRAYNIDGPEKGYWLWDFKSTQRNITDIPLHQDKWHYGGFAYRGAPQWNGPTSAYLTSEGKTRADANGTRVRWCDMSGSIEGQWEGVAILSNPENFRHPEPIRIIPDANYVYFVYCPSVEGEWEMKPGEDHIFRYRLYVHEGKANSEDNERIWNDYAERPQADIRLSNPKNAIVLFDGRDFLHWTGEAKKNIGWEIEDGAMKVVPGTGSIMTKGNFGDFKMHLEFKLPSLADHVTGQDRANSGVYIQRRYEVQILDSYGLEPQDDGCGAIYKIKAPNINACAMPNEWQSYDIIFRAARYDKDDPVKKIENAKITVWQNGVLIHKDVEIPDKTGKGKPEGPEPAPILLQDHDNEVWFRNIWISPL
jgi:hypothetical protein